MAQAGDRGGRVRAARVYAIIAVVMASLTLLEAANAYRAQNGSQCGGGLGNLGPGFNIAFAGLIAALLTLGLVIFTIGSAVTRRRWAWVAGLLTTLAAGIVAVVGSSTAISHQAVGAVLGTGCSWFYPAVTVAAALVLISVVELAYVLAQVSGGGGERAA